MVEAFTIEVMEDIDGVAVVALIGELDVDGTGVLDEHLAQLSARVWSGGTAMRTGAAAGQVGYFHEMAACDTDEEPHRRPPSPRGGCRRRPALRFAAPL
jgi:hypothetical protein